MHGGVGGEYPENFSSNFLLGLGDNLQLYIVIMTVYCHNNSKGGG